MRTGDHTILNAQAGMFEASFVTPLTERSAPVFTLQVAFLSFLKGASLLVAFHHIESEMQ